MAIFRGTGSAATSSDQTTIDTVTQAVVDAEAAQTAAETAQGLAETAKTNAENLYGDLAAVNTAKTAAETAATTATTKASEAATSATNAADDATNANASYILTNGAFLDFQTLFLGTKTVAGGDTIPPVLDNQGNALRDGALYFNGDQAFLYVYNETDDEWINVTPSETVTLSQVSDVTANASEVNVLDVSAETPSDGQVLTYDTTNGLNWETPATPTETNDLTASVTWANVPDANITQSSVTQHQAALSITESQISDLQSYLTAETNDLTAAVTWANVPDANITQSSVTQHQAALSITESQISDFGTYEPVDTDILRADTADTITVPMRGTVTPDNDLSFDMNVTNNFKCTPTGNGTLTFTNITAGQSGNIWLDNSAGVTIYAAATTYISSADLTTINTAGDYFISYFSDGTNVAVSVTQAITGAGA